MSITLNWIVLKVCYINKIALPSLLIHHNCTNLLFPYCQPFSSFKLQNVSEITGFVSKSNLHPAILILYPHCFLNLACPSFLSLTHSLTTGIVPCQLKNAAATPILRNKDSDQNNFKNLCPFLIKLLLKIINLEKVVSSQLHSFTQILSEPFQSAFRPRSQYSNSSHKHR